MFTTKVCSDPQYIIGGGNGSGVQPGDPNEITQREQNSGGAKSTSDLQRNPNEITQGQQDSGETKEAKNLGGAKGRDYQRDPNKITRREQNLSGFKGRGYQRGNPNKITQREQNSGGAKGRSDQGGNPNEITPREQNSGGAKGRSDQRCNPNKITQKEQNAGGAKGRDYKQDIPNEIRQREQNAGGAEGRSDHRCNPSEITLRQQNLGGAKGRSDHRCNPSEITPRQQNSGGAKGRGDHRGNPNKIHWREQNSGGAKGRSDQWGNPNKIHWREQNSGGAKGRSDQRCNPNKITQKEQNSGGAKGRDYKQDIPNEIRQREQNAGGAEGRSDQRGNLNEITWGEQNSRGTKGRSVRGNPNEITQRAHNSGGAKDRSDQRGNGNENNQREQNSGGAKGRDNKQDIPNEIRQREQNSGGAKGRDYKQDIPNEIRQTEQNSGGAKGRDYKQANPSEIRQRQNAGGAKGRSDHRGNPNEITQRKKKLSGAESKSDHRGNPDEITPREQNSGGTKVGADQRGNPNKITWREQNSGGTKGRGDPRGNPNNLTLRQHNSGGAKGRSDHPGNPNEITKKEHNSNGAKCDQLNNPNEITRGEQNSGGAKGRSDQRGNPNKITRREQNLSGVKGRDYQRDNPNKITIRQQNSGEAKGRSDQRCNPNKITQKEQNAGGAKGRDYKQNIPNEIRQREQNSGIAEGRSDQRGNPNEINQRKTNRVELKVCDQQGNPNEINQREQNSSGDNGRSDYRGNPNEIAPREQNSGGTKGRGDQRGNPNNLTLRQHNSGGAKGRRDHQGNPNEITKKEHNSNGAKCEQLNNPTEITRGEQNSGGAKGRRDQRGNPNKIHRREQNLGGAKGISDQWGNPNKIHWREQNLGGAKGRSDQWGNPNKVHWREQNLGGAKGRSDQGGNPNENNQREQNSGGAKGRSDRCNPNEITPIEQKSGGAKCDQQNNSNEITPREQISGGAQCDQQNNPNEITRREQNGKSDYRGNPHELPWRQHNSGGAKGRGYQRGPPNELTRGQETSGGVKGRSDHRGNLNEIKQRQENSGGAEGRRNQRGNLNELRERGQSSSISRDSSGINVQGQYLNSRGHQRPTRGHEEHVDQMRMSHMKDLMGKNPSDVLMSLAASNSGFLGTLQKSDRDTVEAIVVLFAKACQAVGQKATLNHVIQQVNSSGFLVGPVIMYITQGTMNPTQVKHNILCAICDILRLLLDTIPSAASDNVTPVLAILSTLHATIAHGAERDLLERHIEELKQQQTSIVKQIQEGIMVKPGYGHKDDDNEPPDNFWNIPVAPTMNDFCCGIEPFLRKNKISDSYRDVNQYLDIQFRLLREDYLTPFRQGIMQLRRAGSKEVDKRYIQDVRIYEGVQYIDILYSEKGVVCQLQFDTSRLKNVKWEISRRLKYGSLLCLSSDNFSTFVIGTVAESDPQHLHEGFIDVIIDNMHTFQRDTSLRYKMVECSAYFESYRHNLQALQEMHGTELPFKDYLLNTKSLQADPPRYLIGRDTQYDFKPIMTTQASHVRRHILTTKDWPSASELGLDESQFRALQLALTHEFAIIQGPPGTGKTFIGLKIVQLLLHNFDVWGIGLRDEETANCPILLVCHTNHALDQFLEGILKTKYKIGDIIRAGGRSKSENADLKKCNLKCIKRDRDDHLQVQRRDIQRQMEDQWRKLLHISHKLNTINTKILNQDDLLLMMNPHHKLSFERFMIISNECCLHKWLLNSPQQIWLEQLYQGISNDEEQNCTVGTKSKKCFDQTVKISGIIQQKKGIPGIDEWQEVRSKSKNMNTDLHLELNKKEYMSEQEEAMLVMTDVFGLPLDKRWGLYRLWRHKFVQESKHKITEGIDEFNLLAQRLKEIRAREDYHIFRTAKLIAMTTTAAARYRNVLGDVQPRIVIVEEAAEVLEVHIVTSLSASCQHLILIGDHQQLRPNPNVYKLAKKYHLEISLFERMLMNNMHCECLNIQHRMRPEIVRLIVPHVYKSLINHESVLEYDNIRGINGNIFFIEHEHAEKKTFETKSHTNAHEAEYLTALCRYLILQGYENSNVTILTTYTGQMFEIKSLLFKDKEISGVRVTPVDNYQGEENDIILLSLVRSNEEGNIGFLKTANRVCVALSRAKKGFYVIGDMKLMRESSVIWRNILRELEDEGKLVKGLPLFCQNHPDTGINANNVEDFTKAPDGGCSRPCEFRLKCGHVCMMKCHPADPKHNKYRCKKTCMKRPCPEKHECPRRCYEDCGQCMVLVVKKMPKCGHKERIPCHKDPMNHECSSPCERVPTCGHTCPERCAETCGPCMVLVEKTMPKCGHKESIPCHKDPTDHKCSTPCDRVPRCGHICPKSCAEACGKCMVLVEKTMPKCGHKENILCHKDPADHKCSTPCDRVPTCGHVCPKRCAEACGQCMVLIEKIIPRCGHREIIPCQHDPALYACLSPCHRVLTCGHTCPNVCGEGCISNKACNKIVEGRTWPCGHMLDVECFKNVNNYPCPIDIEKTCEKNDKHQYNTKCHEFETAVCKCLCRYKLSCGHSCQGICGTCEESGKIGTGMVKHKSCEFICLSELPCGHKCKDMCGKPCPPCREGCCNMCPHSSCQNQCGEPCWKCQAPCVWSCQHMQCTRLCCERCDRQPCDFPCPFILPCGHQCAGYCGEPCPCACLQCHNRYYQQMHIALETPKELDARYVLLMPCNHIITCTYMDKMVQSYLDNARRRPRELQIFQCPLCHVPVRYCPRYQLVVFISHQDMESMKCTQNTSNSAILARSDISSIIPKKINNSSGIDTSSTPSTDAELRRYIGCIGLLNECHKITNRIRYAKRTPDKDVIVSLDSDNKTFKQELMCIILGGTETTRQKLIELRLKLSLLFLRAVVCDMLPYVESKHQQYILINLIRDATRKHVGCSNLSMRQTLIFINHQIITSIPIGVRGGVEDYINEMDRYFNDNVDGLKNIKWIICEYG